MRQARQFSLTLVICGHCRTPSRRPWLALVGHEARAVVAVGFQSVVRWAPESQVLSGIRTTFGPWLPVSKLQAAGRVAAVAVLADKTAAPFVAWPHFPAD